MRQAQRKPSRRARALSGADLLDEATREEDKGARARRRFLLVWTAVGGILLAGVVVYLLNILSVPVGIVIWTTILVFCLRGPVNWLEKKGVSRTVGTTLAYVLLVVVLGAILLLMFSPAFGLGGQFSDLLENIPIYVQNVIDWGNGLYAQYSHVFEDETIHQWITDAQASLLSWASSLAKDSAWKSCAWTRYSKTWERSPSPCRAPSMPWTLRRTLRSNW